MADESPLTPTPASVAVQEAFDRYYSGLVGELTAVCGSAGAAEAAVDEAFRRAAAMPDFAEIGRPEDWLRVTSRNHVVRRPFRRDDLDGTAGTPTAASFERPSLEGSLSRARSAHRAGMIRRAGLGAAGAVLAVGAVFAATAVSPWASSSAQPAASTPPSRTRSSPPLIPTSDPPTSLTPTVEPWPPTTPEEVVGHKDARQAYVVESPQVATRRAIVWERCRGATSASYRTCEQDDSARAVEVVDGTGHRLIHLLVGEQVVRPAFNGTFAIFTPWGSDDHALVSPTMRNPKPFEVRTGARARPGQRFSECASGPCLVDLHGTVTLLDLPTDVQWDTNTASGWVGTQVFEILPGSVRVFIQQDDETFATVDVAIKVPTQEGDAPYASTWPDGTVAIWTSTQSGFAQLALSSDRGRTWTVRWADPAQGWNPSSRSTMPIVAKPGITISALRKWSPNR